MFFVVLGAVTANAGPLLGPYRADGLEGLAGVVIDASNDQPLAGLEVVASGLDVSDRAVTSTNPRGLFHFPRLAPGTYEVWAHPKGHLRAKAEARVVTGNAGLVALSIIKPYPAREVAPAAAEEPPLPRAQRRAGPLRFEVRLARKIFAVGEPVPLLGLFRNRGAEPVVVLKQVDKSLSTRRSPGYEVQLTSTSGQPAPAIPRRESSFCGTRNALMPGDVVELQPGQTTDPFEPLDEYHSRSGALRLDALAAFERPGKFRAWVDYINLESDEWGTGDCVYMRLDAYGRPPLVPRSGEDLAQLRARHPPIPKRAPLRVERLRSNAVDFEIVDSVDAAGLVRFPAPIEDPFRPARLVVRVFDSRGAPIPRAQTWGAGGLIDAKDGTHRANHALPGRYEIIVRANSKELERQTIELAPGDDRTLDFREQGYGSLRVAIENLEQPGAWWVPLIRLLPGQVPMPEDHYGLHVEGSLDYEQSRTEPVFPKVRPGKHTLFIGRRLRDDRLGLFRQEVEIRANEETFLELDLPDELPIIPRPRP